MAMTAPTLGLSIPFLSQALFIFYFFCFFSPRPTHPPLCLPLTLSMKPSSGCARGRDLLLYLFDAGCHGWIFHHMAVEASGKSSFTFILKARQQKLMIAIDVSEIGQQFSAVKPSNSRKYYIMGGV